MTVYELYVEGVRVEKSNDKNVIEDRANYFKGEGKKPEIKEKKLLEEVSPHEGSTYLRNH